MGNEEIIFIASTQLMDEPTVTLLLALELILTAVTTAVHVIVN